MSNWFKRILGIKKCYICNKKPSNPSPYIDDYGKKALVCYKCVPYAERRAIRKA